jgi:hypothetical protein
MDVLNVGEKKYIKASVIARALGYTADYVGQLCRAGKVDAKLVGRSWYVLEDSIQTHKQDRYRSSQVKSLQHVEKHIKQTNEEPEEEAKSHFYTRTRGMRQLSYTTDDAELMPPLRKQPIKRHVMGIGLADATSIKIDADREGLVFETPAVPKIKFKGTLTVSDFKEDEVLDVTGGRIIHPTESRSFSVFKKTKNKVISAKRVSKKEKNTSHLHPSDFEHTHPTEVVYLHDQVSSGKTSVVAKTLSYLVVFFAFLLANSFFVVTNTIEATAMQSKSTYTFTIEHVQDLIASFL